jgi:hypothetical protein
MEVLKYGVYNFHIHYWHRRTNKIQNMVASIGLFANIGRNQQNCCNTLQSSILGYAWIY